MIPRVLSAIRELGLPSLSQYGWYSLALRSGYFRRRLPLRSWSQVALSGLLGSGVPSDPEALLAYHAANREPSCFDLKRNVHRIRKGSEHALVARGKAIESGEFCLFGSHEVKFDIPPDWHAFAPLAGVGRGITVPGTMHWSRYDLNALPHDVKLVWELSRFAWVFPLVQAYAVSGDRRYFDTFWDLYQSWKVANPPQMGVHWYSAQEVAFRLIALLFAAQTFSAEFQSQPEKWIDLLKAIAVHAQRIPPSLSYARAQNNNHLLLESAGLFLTGLMMPELGDAERWKRHGKRTFEAGVLQQTFPDGGYVQHSTNYHRLALEIGLLVAHVAADAGDPLAPSTLNALGQMATCLAVFVDEELGAVPNFGPNDGARLLPLSIRPFGDYRPTIQAAWKLFFGEGYYPEGEWDDMALWLGIADGAPRRTNDDGGRSQAIDLPQAGLHLTRKNGLKVSLRAASFQNRPGHSDQLHLDIWYEGINLAHDPGTFLYNAPTPWDNAFSGAWCHNTVMLDGREPMLKGGRFLWLDWSLANVVRYEQDDLHVLFARHLARRWSGMVHQRSIAILGCERIVVVDDILGKDEHQVALNWNLPDLAWDVIDTTLVLKHEKFNASLSFPAEEVKWGIYRAGKSVAGEAIVNQQDVHGWHAPSYALREPGLQLVVQSTRTLPVRMMSTWVFDGDQKIMPDIQWSPIQENRVAFGGIQWGAVTWSN